MKIYEKMGKNLSFTGVFVMILMCVVNGNLLTSRSLFMTYSGGMTPEQVPNPILHYTGCGRDVASFICDPSNYLDPKALKRLDDKIFDIHSHFKGESPCPNVKPPHQADGSKLGYQVGIAVIEKMKMNFYDNKEEVAEEFARKVFDYWEIGEFDCQNGALVFLSIEDRIGFIATGRITRKRLTDWKARDIIRDDMKYYLRRQNYGTALEVALDRIYEELLKPEANWSWGFILNNVVFYGVLMPLIFCCCIPMCIYGCVQDCVSRSNYRLATQRIHKLENDRDALIRNKYSIDTCPICLEELTFNVPSQFVTHEELQRQLLARSQSFSRFHRFKNWIKSCFGYGDSIRTSRYQETSFGGPESQTLLGSSGPGEKRTVTNLDDFGRAFDQANAMHDHHWVRLEEGTGRATTRLSRNAFAIKCGHIFCEDCIKSWLSEHDTCPICLAKVIDRPTPVAVPLGIAADTAYESERLRQTERNYLLDRELERISDRIMLHNHLTAIQNQMLWDDLIFRSARLHWYHPWYVNRGMVDHFRSEPETSYLSRHQHYIDRQNAMHRNENKNHHATTTTSRFGGSSGVTFGGGHSSGGGGSSW